MQMGVFRVQHTKLENAKKRKISCRLRIEKDVWPYIAKIAIVMC